MDKSIPMPAAPTTVMRYQVYMYRHAIENGLSSANSKMAISAISSFHEQDHVENPTLDPFVRLLTKGTSRALGTRGTQKKALLNRDMRALYEKWVVPDPQDAGILAHMLRMALCQEALLRFDELANITFGDILITETCLHIFIFESKTDKVRKGQWVPVYRDGAPWKAYTLLHTFVVALQNQWGMMYDNYVWARLKWAGMTAIDPATGCAYMSINELPLMFGFQPLFKGWRKA